MLHASQRQLQNREIFAGLVGAAPSLIGPPANSHRRVVVPAARVGERGFAAGYAMRLPPPPRHGGSPPFVPPPCGTPQYYGPDCAPCGPASPEDVRMAEAYQRSQWDEHCRVQEMRRARAESAVIASQQPQIALGIGGIVLAGATTTFQATPTVPLCLTRFIVSRAFAQFFVITSIRAARIEYLADGGAIPADWFTTDTTTPPIDLPKLWPGTPVTVIVTNRDGADHFFDAGFAAIPLASAESCL